MNISSIFSVGRLHADHLSLRQNATARNIANISVPGYKAVGVTDFATFLRSQSTIRSDGLAANSTQRHLKINQDTISDERSPTQGLSGNNVSLESEIMNSGSIRREMNISTTLLKSFHKMYLTALRG